MSLNQLLEAMLEPKREAIREEGREEGIVIGREKGREEERQKSEQEKRTAASKLSLMGLSSYQIAEAISVDPIVVESWLAGN